MRVAHSASGKCTPKSPAASETALVIQREPPEPILFKRIPPDINGDLLRPLFLMPPPQLVTQVRDLMLVSRNWQAAVLDVFLRRQAGNEASLALAQSHRRRLGGERACASDLLKKVWIPYGCLDLRNRSSPEAHSPSRVLQRQFLQTLVGPEVNCPGPIFDKVVLRCKEDVAQLAASIKWAGKHGLSLNLHIGGLKGRAWIVNYLAEILLRHWVGGAIKIQSDPSLPTRSGLFSRLAAKIGDRGRYSAGLKNASGSTSCCLVLPPLVPGITRRVL